MIGNGSVKVWFGDRDFGFVAPDDGSADLFVGGHAVRMAGIGALAKGDRVAFDIEHDGGGRRRACNLARVGSRLGEAEKAFRPAHSGGPVKFGDMA